MSRQVYALLTLCCFALSGCQVEQRVIRKKQWFEGLPGVEQGGQPVRADAPDAPSTPLASTGPQIPENKLREVVPASPNAPAQVTLISRTGRHLLVHIYETLRDNERELFAEQVLSERTREEFLSRGFSATDAFDLLKAQEEQVVTLLQQIPDAEATPGVRMLAVGNRVQRVLLGANAMASQQLSPGLVGIDMVMERGSWRLRWFVPGAGYEMPRILEPWEREALRQQQIARGQAPTNDTLLLPESLQDKPEGVQVGLDALMDEAPAPQDAPAAGVTPARPERPLPPPR
jgi:hypothetical protein